MQPVPASPRLVTGSRRVGLAALLAVLAAALVIGAVALTAPGPAAAPQAAPYNGLIGGVALQNAHCVQWNAGSDGEKDKVAAALAHSVGGATPYGPGTTLTTSQTHTLFDNACASPIAQHWLLYELYIRAAGFRSYVSR